MRKKALIILMVLSLFVLSSCGNKSNTGEKTETAANTSDFKEDYNEIGFDNFDFSAIAFDNIEYNNKYFENSKVTMINFWATTCGPCINELPEIEELTKDFSKEDFQVMGVVVNTYEGYDDSIKEAEKIMKDKGVNYLNIIPNDNLYTNYLQNIQFVPTTVFVNKEGKLVGPVITGAKSKDGYKEIITNILENIK